MSHAIFSQKFVHVASVLLYCGNLIVENVVEIKELLCENWYLTRGHDNFLESRCQLRNLGARLFLSLWVYIVMTNKLKSPISAVAYVCV
jgi:hypothetical protein